MTRLVKLRLTASSQRIAGFLETTGRPGCATWLATTTAPRFSQHVRHGFFSSRQEKAKTNKSKSPAPGSVAVMIMSGWLVYTLRPADESQHLDSSARISRGNAQTTATQEGKENAGDGDQSAWSNFAGSFEGISTVVQVEGAKLSDKVVDLILPEWSRYIPGYVRKLQRELNMAPGSLADEIWQEAHDPEIHPEIQYSACVRVSEHLCDDEKTFLTRRRKITAVALAKYLGLDERDVHPDDVPVIAVSGSGGGLRALVAGTGSFLATAEDGLFDCVTYTSGVSGSCWLQALFHSSITERDLNRAIDHLKARLGVHIAYPPAAFSSLVSAPTNKYLLSGMVEKLKGDSGADIGLVDAYGMLLAARLLVPKGELEVSENDFKLSNQRECIQYGQNPMPIYTAVRHEIPELNDTDANRPGPVSEEAKARAKRAAWFQWFEMTPYEFFCEEFTAGIPTWAMGRKFKGGVDVAAEEGLRLPETRMPLLLGIWGSAFCATLSHYYREIRPLVKSLAGLQAVDELIWGHNEDLSKVHPIDPATLPNFVHGMQGKLPASVPDNVYESEYLQLMDAGMSNNLPIYPLLRPGRDVEIIVAFDASADIKTDNWLSVVEGYARQRGIKGWPVGIGWPKASASPSTTAKELDRAEADSAPGAEGKLTDAKVDQATRQIEAGANTVAEEMEDTDKSAAEQKADKAANELGYCTVWVGTTQERRSEDPPPPPVDDSRSWKLMEPDAGIAVIYLPLLANDKVEGVDPATSDYMSTWNFVYTPEQVDKVVALARANYEEGRAQIRATVRAVYERKKRKRLEERDRVKKERYRRLMRLGIAGKLGEGDHFS
ncbi:acyl transferase/acyl hydrolase/lysophospholipase [Apodospora peruviana]|uniref:Lysophospholipase n=1 Tax=Apodospora peruviana TaxID=516989 RepID=A0AAE0I4V1_9PEZI|nr:acyl transferase/acyl hydrolase/lysophospholipase [Apodospora peruviana]